MTISLKQNVHLFLSTRVISFLLLYDLCIKKSSRGRLDFILGLNYT